MVVGCSPAIYQCITDCSGYGKLNDDRRLLAGDGVGDAIGDKYRCVSSTCNRDVSCWMWAFLNVLEYLL